METVKVEKVQKENRKEITFKCKFCDTTKPVSEMTVMNRFFPLAVACLDCSRKVEVKH